MTATKITPQHGPDWETEDAPRIAPGYWWLVVAVFSLWVAFLVAMSIHRWIMTLQ